MLVSCTSDRTNNICIWQYRNWELSTYKSVEDNSQNKYFSLSEFRESLMQLYSCCLSLNAGPQPHHSRKKRYAEGWVEYLDKKKAKRVVALLNNQLVGGMVSFHSHC